MTRVHQCGALEAGVGQRAGRAAVAWLLLAGALAAQENEETRERWQRVPAGDSSRPGSPGRWVAPAASSRWTSTRRSYAGYGNERRASNGPT